MDSLSFDLPGISPVGLDLIAMLSSPNATIKQIGSQAKLDPVIFGNIIACANSPMFHDANKSTDILTSLVRLGQREIKRIVYQVVLRSAFFHESSELNAILRRIWHQSLTASVFMHKLVSAVPEAYNLEAEDMDILECLGLVHNIGYVVLLASFQDRFLEFSGNHHHLSLPEYFREECGWFNGFDHFAAGKAVLAHWHFPEGLCDLVAQYGLPSHEYNGEFPGLHSLLRLARHVVMMTEYNFHPCKPASFWIDGTDVPAVEIDYDQIIAEVRDTVRSIEGSFA